MQYRMIRTCIALTMIAAAAGCSKSNPVQPSGSASADTAGSLTASIAAPRPLTPSNNAAIKNIDQPVTLAVLNAVSTKPGVTYTFEVATDAAFNTKAQTKENIAEASGGQTTVKLDALPAEKDYYWHVRASSSGTTGVFGATYKFTIGPAISIAAPVPTAPLTGAATSDRPTFTVTDAVKAGPAGALTYVFEIADNSAFSPVLITGSVSETAGQTSFAPTVALPTAKTLYWRATAVDQAHAIASAPSTAQSFTATNPLWPAQQPPAGSGHAQLGNGWDTQTLTSFDGVRFDSPTLEERRIFDLLDRGLDPQGALDWLNSHGYPTSAVWYSSVQAFGFQYQYMALINGYWELVLRIGA